MRDDRDALAMTLELADLMGYGNALDDWWDVQDTQQWLRAQVIQALREGR